MKFFDKLKSVFTGKPSVSANVFTDLQALFDVDPDHKIPRDMDYERVSVMTGIVLDGTGSTILGYNPLKVYDDGSIDVNLKGATIELGDLDVHITAIPAAGKPADSVRIYGSTSDPTPVQEQLLTVNRRLQVDANISTSPIIVDDNDVVAAGKTGLPLQLDILYGYDTTAGSWKRVHVSNGGIIVDGLTNGSQATMIVDSLGDIVGTTANALDVNIKSQISGTSVNVYNEVSGVLSGVLTVVTTYTVPGGKTFYLKHIEVSGDSIATVTVVINGVISRKKRVYFNEYNEDFYFPGEGISVPTGQVVQIKAIHNRTTTATFNGTIYGVEI